ncbi:Aspartokinase [hydrothermal vent metagenome]|uniref:aspartate kinase n=1 Tax=hydrothermal vent metagenome TaxID=652676 RepID=A0A3B0W0N3_9ZZZZ
MALIIQKYGGTSVGTTDRIKNVAARVKKARACGDDIIVVVSAMSGETNRLIGLAEEVAGNPDGREFDTVVSTGEQVTIGLLAMALAEIDCPATSLTGWQIPIETEGFFNAARVKAISGKRIKAEFEKGRVVIVAGFQGVSACGDIMTLGRGGSDTTAVALAAALKADLCEIYTDVDGVFTTDPGVCRDARKLQKISYDEMLEMASLGAKVLQTRSVEFAKKYKVPLMVRSSFNDSLGTMVSEEDQDMEKVMVSGITYNKNEAKISVVRVPDRPGIAARLFRPLTESGVNVDMIVQNISHDSYTDLTFTVAKGDYKKAIELVKSEAKEFEAQDVLGDTEIAKISIVGAGMRSHAGVASKMFETLAAADINVQMISTSEIKVSCVIDEAKTEEAVRILHDAFELGKDDIEEEELV